MVTELVILDFVDMLLCFLIFDCFSYCSLCDPAMGSLALVFIINYY